MWTYLIKLWWTPLVWIKNKGQLEVFGIVVYEKIQLILWHCVKFFWKEENLKIKIFNSKWTASLFTSKKLFKTIFTDIKKWSKTDLLSELDQLSAAKCWVFDFWLLNLQVTARSIHCKKYSCIYIGMWLLRSNFAESWFLLKNHRLETIDSQMPGYTSDFYNFPDWQNHSISEMSIFTLTFVA